MKTPDGLVWGQLIHGTESIPLGPVLSDRDIFVRVVHMEMGFRDLKQQVMGMMAVREAIMSTKEGSSYSDDALESFFNIVAPFLGVEKEKKQKEIAEALERETQQVFKVRPIKMPTRSSPYKRRRKRK